MINPFESLDARLSNIENLLLDIKHSPSLKETNHDGELLNIREAGLVINLKPPTIYGLVSRNEIPFFKKGKRLYFNKSELIKWVHSGRKDTIQTINTVSYLKKKGAVNG